MSRPLPCALLLAVCLAPLSSAARAADGAISEVKDGDRLAGWTVDAQLLREDGAKTIAQKLVALRFTADTALADRARLSRCLEAFLVDLMGRARAPAKIFVDRDAWALRVHEYTGPGELETLAKLEAAEGGGTFGQPGGLAIYQRPLADAAGPFARVSQYLDGDVVDFFRSSTEDHSAALGPLARGPVLVRANVIHRFRRAVDGALAELETIEGGAEPVAAADPGGERSPAVCSALMLPTLRPPPCASADLSWQFPDFQDQDDLGSCHSFAATAAAEAALRRAYGLKIKLSEGDVFAQGMLKSGAAYGPLRQTKQLEEGGEPTIDIAAILRHGAATERTVPYQEIQTRVKRLEKGIAKLGPKGRAAVQALLGTPDDAAPVIVTPRAVAVTRAHGRAVAQSPRVLEERAVIKAALAGAGVETEDLFKRNGGRMTDGLYAREWIAERLCRGVPVVASLYFKSTAEWNHPDKDFTHAIVISGFTTTDEGIVFRTRNSWGGTSGDMATTNPELRPKDHSAIFRVMTLDLPRPSTDPELLRGLRALSSP